MKSNYKTIGELVERIDQRNTEGSITNLIGVSIDKKFISSVANVIGTDLTKYKVIEKFDFAVSLMQVSRDEKIPVACQKEFDKAIMSPAYPIFRVKDTSIILPEYLEMWFMRPEFDREASFIAVGGVRGSMPWEDFARIEVCVPPIEEQQKIVKAYQTITKRIELKKKINDNLEAQAQALFTSWFVNFEPFEHSNDEDGKALPPDNWENGTLGSCIDFLNGYAFKSDDLLDEPTDNCYDVFKMGNIKKGGGLNYDGTKSWIEREFCIGLERFVLRTGDILMSMTDMKENVALLGHTALMDIENKYIVNQRVGLLRPNGYLGISPYQIYLLTNNPAFLRELRRHAHIGVQVNLSKEDIVNSRLIYAPKEVNMNFENLVRPIFKAISLNNAEILKLNDVAIQIQAQLSR